MESWTDGSTRNVVLVVSSLTISIRFRFMNREIRMKLCFFIITKLEKNADINKKQWICTWSKTDYSCNTNKTGMCQISSTEYQSTLQSRKMQQSTHSHLHVACSAESQNARSL